ncbi:uncharacterized protein YdeI (YjbR/CyaY-like superfamily) [Dokdonia sp. Hel_I_53]|nr:uncharacterized protein YdeI (YjbR/CyaY-like superfamily) [Dokdonia sp. Hel_I_53]
MTKAEKISDFYSKPSPWKTGIADLRKLVLDAGLKEDWKWSFPTYTYKGKNVVGIASFQNHFGLWFFQGALLTDKKKQLRNAQEGKTKAMRHLIYTSYEELNPTIALKFIDEAIENAKQGKKVQSTPTQSKVVLPIMLKNALLNDAQLQLNFDALSSSKQREYGMYINEAKQEATKQRRLEKCIPLILNGKGLNDTYR